MNRLLNVLRRLIVFLGIAWGSIQAGSAVASRPCDGVGYWHEMRLDQNRLLSLLRKRNFDELDTLLGSRQSSYEAGNYREEDLYYSFESFRNSDAALTPLLREWVNRYPMSYSAVLALAIHRAALAWAARGDKLRHETTDEQWQLFRPQLHAAEKDLQQAKKLSTKKTISYYAFAIGNARDLANRAAVESVFKDA